MFLAEFENRGSRMRRSRNLPFAFVQVRKILRELLQRRVTEADRF